MQSTRGVAALFLLAVAAVPAAAGDKPGAHARVDVAILDEHGAPVFCTHNQTGGLAQPDGGGGYRLLGLEPGRWVVSLDLPHERVDVMVTVEPGEAIVVPPVIARGACRSIGLTRRPDLQRLVDGASPTWSMHFDRTYRSQRGQLATGLSWKPRTTNDLRHRTMWPSSLD
jgi:hypothetical protein